MNKKELYNLSVKIAGGALSGFFEAPTSNFLNMESTTGRKKARKNVYDILASIIIPKND